MLILAKYTPCLSPRKVAESLKNKKQKSVRMEIKCHTWRERATTFGGKGGKTKQNLESLFNENNTHLK